MKEFRDIFNSLFLNLPFKPFPAGRLTDPGEMRRLLADLAPKESVKPLIRLGPQEDGGYLVPDDLEGISTCFSPGVSTVSGFETDCANRGMDVFMADASVDAPADSHPRFRFLKKFIGPFTDGDFITMDDWIKTADPAPEADWLFQIDIEGAEFDVLLNIPERHLRRARIIVIEFHMLDYLFDQCFFNIAAKAFRKLLLHHSCVHIHPNNSGTVISSRGIRIPKIMEFTFYRNDRGLTNKPARLFPNPLDRQCVPDYPALHLPRCWIG